MTRICLVAVAAAAAAVLLVVVAGCGSEDAPSPVTRTVTAAAGDDASGGVTASQDAEEQEDSASRTAPDRDRSQDPFNALALASGKKFAATYCVHKIGAVIGAESPPTSRMRRLKNRLISTAAILSRDAPDLEVSGVTIKDFLLASAKMLRNGDCDLAGARKLQQLARSLPG